MFQRHFAAILTTVATTVLLAALPAAAAPRQPASGRSAAAKPARECLPFEVREARLAHDVERRQTIGEAEVYEPGDTVHALAVVRNPGEKTPIEMVWKRDDVVRSRVQLDVGTGHGWRTWSKHRLSKKDVGAWTVEIRSQDGSLLETLSFEVTRSIAGI